MSDLGGLNRCSYYDTCGNEDNCKGCKGFTERNLQVTADREFLIYDGIVYKRYTQQHSVGRKKKRGLIL